MNKDISMKPPIKKSIILLFILFAGMMIITTCLWRINRLQFCLNQHRLAILTYASRLGTLEAMNDYKNKEIKLYVRVSGAGSPERTGQYKDGVEIWTYPCPDPEFDQAYDEYVLFYNVNALKLANNTPEQNLEHK